MIFILSSRHWMGQLSPMAFPLPSFRTPHEVSRTSTYFQQSTLRPWYLNRLNSFTLQNYHGAQLCVKKGNSDSENASANGNCILGNHAPNGALRDVDNPNISIWKEIEYVEVFAIGSRKDAVLDFCLNSPSLPPALRFWNILLEDPSKMQLRQRFSNPDLAARIVEAPSDLKSCSKAVILVASAGYGSDDVAALSILQTIKYANGFVIGLVLKPFNFEGQRRQDEVNYLVEKLQKHANFCIAVDTNRLLEKDMVTLDEALKTSNNAVLMAINAVSVLISEKHKKLLEVPEKGIKEFKAHEIQEILGSYRSAIIGFGAGCNIKNSVSRAVYDCPFLGKSLKDSSGKIVCIIASSGIITNNDSDSILRNVRLTTECKTEIMLSIIHDPNLEGDLILTTIIAFGQQSSQKNNIFCRLANRFPFIFNILKKQYQQLSDSEESYVSETPRIPEASSNGDSGEVSDKTSLHLDDRSEVLRVHNEDVDLLQNDVDGVLFSSRSEEIAAEFSEPDLYSLKHISNAQGIATFGEQQLSRYCLGPDIQNKEELGKEVDALEDTTLLPDSVNIYRLPVGVRHLEQLNDHPVYTKHENRWRTEEYRRPEVTPSVSWNGVIDWVYEASVDINSISSSKRGSNVGDLKEGILSVRAASMLEFERDSDKVWSPIVEMKYRGGIYRGRIQGGLPEGKGRLSLENGSIYDGIWRYGRKSGLGTLYFKNGDVFQGSWRDDAMHGKGWFYFHTGDRWFINFWKGKANGEGRFYSKLGDVFFGHFKNGWRHGRFLCISVDGTSCHEIWEEGVLVSKEQLDPDARAT